MSSSNLHVSGSSNVLLMRNFPLQWILPESYFSIVASRNPFWSLSWKNMENILMKMKLKGRMFPGWNMIMLLPWRKYDVIQTFLFFSGSAWTVHWASLIVEGMKQSTERRWTIHCVRRDIRPQLTCHQLRCLKVGFLLLTTACYIR